MVKTRIIALYCIYKTTLHCIKIYMLTIIEVKSKNNVKKLFGAKTFGIIKLQIFLKILGKLLDAYSSLHRRKPHDY
jgi:hypothetical protein